MLMFFCLHNCLSGPKPSDLGTLITSLKIARDLGLMKLNKTSHGMVAPPNTSFWYGIVPVELMRKALCHSDDQVLLTMVKFNF